MSKVIQPPVRKLVHVTSVALALLAGSVPSQELVWRVTGTPATSGPTGGRQIGGRTIDVGDIDHDGYEDVLTIVSSQCSIVPDPGQWGHLWLLSGIDGALIRDIAGPMIPAPFTFLSIAAAGDMNGDLTPDYVAGMVDASAMVNHRVEVRSGVDDSVVWSAPTFYPDEVLGDIDVDGDGLKDVIVGDEHSLGYWGKVNVYSHGGQLLYQLSGSASANPVIAIAACFAKLGDVDDDGCDDFVMGCYETTARGVSVIVSGRTGAYIRYCYGELPGDVLCYAMDNCGDIDLDGYEDFVVSNDAGSAARGVIRVFSSRTGQILRGWTEPLVMGTNCIASRGVDLDGDAMPDFVAGANGEIVSPQQRGAVYAFSGRDSSQLHRVPSAPPFGQVGYRVTVLKAPAGRHTGYFVVPDLWASWTTGGGCSSYTMGAISVYSGIPRTTQILGLPCSGNLSSAPNIGMQSLASTGVRVELSRAPAGAPAVLLLGLSTTQIFGVPLPLPIDPLGFPGCLLRTSIEAQFLVVTGTAGQDAGYANLDLPHPIPASGLGTMTLAGQWVVLGLGNQFPGGLTQAITWRR